MSTAFLASIPIDGLDPSRLWPHVPAEVRKLAAHSLYARDREDPAARQLADAFIARALRFREVAVRKLPLDRRVEYLTRAVRPDDSLASSLLLALHMANRRPMLSAFLDALGVPHDNGAISDAPHLARQPKDRLETAAKRLLAAFPEEDVEIYLASLLAMDPTIWGSLAGVLEELRRGESST